MGPQNSFLLGAVGVLFFRKQLAGQVKDIPKNYSYLLWFTD
jgi:hypothetical protein